MATLAEPKQSRINLFYVLIVIIFAAFGWRLFDLQVLNGDRYSLLAKEEQQRKFEISPSRGVIYMRDGDETVPLVLNELRPTLFADPTGVDDPSKVARELSEIINSSEEKIKESLEVEDSSYQVIKKKLTQNQADKVIEADLAGIGLQDVSYRVYPESGLAAQIVGFVNNDGQGQYGIEAALDDQLVGRSGLLKAVTDINGIPLTTDEDTVEVPAENGQDITLTIDRNIQKRAEEAVAKGVKSSQGDSGSAIVMNPNTGEILAMANYPTFQPAKYTSVKEKNYSVFQNSVISDAYETGSGVKVFTMSAGLNEEVVSIDSTYFDAGFVQIEDRLIENAGNSAGGTRTMLEVIQNSVNTGVVHVLQKLGGGQVNDKARDTLYQYFTDRFGFGTSTGIAQTNESAGLIISPDEEEGNNVRYANMVFGQGMTVTMLQMVSAFSSIINGGEYYQPKLIAQEGDNIKEPKVLRTNVVNKRTTRDLVKMTKAVVDNGGGYSAQRPGYLIGGKTGTSQILDPTTGEYSETRENGSFIGYGGSSSPEFVIMTRVNDPKIPGYAGTVAAAPIFAELSNYMIDYWQIPPSN